MRGRGWRHNRQGNRAGSGFGSDRPGRGCQGGGSTLDCMRAGDHFEVTEVADEGARVNALRFGMAEGACLDCVTRIPAGPIVIRAGRQEIAVGRKLARRISVREVQRPPVPTSEHGAV